jgi:hypothetical protein
MTASLPPSQDAKRDEDDLKEFDLPFFEMLALRLQVMVFALFTRLTDLLLLWRPRLLPAVPALSGVVAIAANSAVSLALKDDGTVWGWGSNANGQLGNIPTPGSTTPVQVQGLSQIKALSAGDTHALAVHQDGTVWAWGRNSSGQLGL